MADFKVYSDFEPQGSQPEAIKHLSNGVKNKNKHQTLLGITGSGKTFTMAKVVEQVQKPTIILSHNKVLAAQLYGEFKSLFPDNHVEFFISYYDYYQPEAYLPTKDLFIEKDMSINEEIDRMRLRATASLVNNKDVIIISSVSCIYGLGDPKEYSKLIVTLLIGKIIELKETFKKLVSIHYIRNDLVLEPGTFRVRGDVVEIHPPYEEFAYRIELFGDEIEKIESFHPVSGEVIKNLKELYIFPAKHFVTTQENMNRALIDIRSELITRLEDLREQGLLVEAQRLEQRTFYDMEMMTELGYCSGIENYSRHLEGRKPGTRPHTLLDFFPDDYLMFIDESHVSIPQIKAMYKGDLSRKNTLIEYGFRLPSAKDNRPMKFNEFENIINQVIYVSATPSAYEDEKSDGNVIEQIIRPTGLLDPEIKIHPSKGQIDHLIGEIKSCIKRNERILITTLTKKSAENLSEYLEEVNIKAKYLHYDIDTIDRVKILRGLRMKDFDVLVGINLLREGLDMPEVSLVAVVDADKEGFLRSRSTLLQVAGRAARNINGRVIFYADKITNSIKSVIEETQRRRQLQIDHNNKNGIIPKTILKSIDDIKLSTAVADERDDYFDIDQNKISEIEIENIEDIEALENLKKKMFKFARDLQFEKAALLRDKISEIENKL
ncbi:MAG: excinuclease ABC subunit UvrB [Candidatus Neomarinimicrobiota bacterium]|nr:excinuclease ABC subunit UvrB [Candidatus Neomarinimicrobiota bacterium]|tara:strand:- start:4650 stop:6638 length:1989 start_codon:yes stop_codon:yes gene_type:complete